MPFRPYFRIAEQYQPSHHLPASITISPQATPARGASYHDKAQESGGDRDIPANPARLPALLRRYQNLRDDAGEDRGRHRPHPRQQIGALVNAAAKPQPEHPPDFIGQEARDHEQFLQPC
jgi:hypothetical protein